MGADFSLPFFGVRNEISVRIVSRICRENNLIASITIVAHTKEESEFISSVSAIVEKGLEFGCTLFFNGINYLYPNFLLRSRNKSKGELVFLECSIETVIFLPFEFGLLKNILGTK